MIENFIEYMWYLLTTPLKKLKKALNKWYTLCRVFGRRFDEAKEDILRARDEGMVATCSHEMLPVHGADRRLTRYEGEHPENYRSRIAMYDELCKLGGTNEGVLLAVWTLGYRSSELIRANDLAGYNGEGGGDDRWAEFYIVITMQPDEEQPISFDILQKMVRKWKEVGAKDNYLFVYRLDDLATVADALCRIVLGMECSIVVDNRSRVVFCLYTESAPEASFHVDIENNFFYLDGTYSLDGAKSLNTYKIKEEL